MIERLLIKRRPLTAFFYGQYKEVHRLKNSIAKVSFGVGKLAVALGHL